MLICGSKLAVMFQDCARKISPRGSGALCSETGDLERAGRDRGNERTNDGACHDADIDREELFDEAVFGKNRGIR